ncbi:unnamed protein product [Phytophthora fragariaefolia]|uniref:Unnamed protein product n=1 Tax=Phytophthora fragariaefolia TaxID=1490495 RepID=A0A9W6YQG4_9STRA|nr:unnamed protein product [Phytophthora fragariaefolia]
MNRELDGLLDKLSRLNQEMGGDDGKGKKKDKKGDHFHELKTKIGERLHHLKMSKFPPEELAMRKEIVTQYWAEYERIKELAATNYRSPAGRTTFDTGGVAAPIGSFENGAFTTRKGPGGGPGGPVFGGFGGGGGLGGSGDGPIEREVVTDDQRAMLADIQKNDQRFVRVAARSETVKVYRQANLYIVVLALG